MSRGYETLKSLLALGAVGLAFFSKAQAAEIKAPTALTQSTVKSFSQWLETAPALPSIEQNLFPAEVEVRLPGAVAGTPSLIQMSGGTPGNFVLVSPAENGGLLHFWRDNAGDPERAWHGGRAFGQRLGTVQGVSILANPNLEMVATSQGRIVHFWRYPDPNGEIYGPFTVGQGGQGTPSLIRSRIGKAGDFELAVPSVNGGIDFYWRENDVTGLPWRGPVRVGQNLGNVDDVTLMQSNYGNGNFELFVRTGSRLAYFWKFPERNQLWQGPFFFFEGAAGNPVLLQSHFGRQGNFELAVPSSTGGIDYYWRNNDASGLPWVGPTKLYSGIPGIRALSLIQQSNGSMEMVYRVGNRLDYVSRESGSWSTPFPLSGPVDISTGPGPAPALRKAYTETLGHLISAPGSGGTNDVGRVGIMGTDLGSSFEWNGLLVFLFGDTWSYSGPGSRLDGPGFNEDSVASTDATRVDRYQIPPLNFHTQANGRFTPLRVPGVSLGGMEVPVEGLSIGGIPYIFFVTGYYESGSTGNYRQSVLAHMDTYKGGFDAARLTMDHVVSTQRFLNVSAVQEDGYVYIFGVGNPYRGSNVFLARVAPESIGNRALWTYFRGTTRGQPIYGPWESSATALFQSACVGEFSVRKHPATGLYLMTYGCTDAAGRRGYHLRTASAPSGPWSESELIYDLSVPDGGYGVTEHISTSLSGPRASDGLGEYNHFNLDSWGGEYGPYLIPRWFTSQGGTHSIVYTHSSWNPYKTHLMRTVLVEPGRSATRSPAGSGLPRAAIVNADFSQGVTTGWQTTGTRFEPFTRGKGEGCVRTFVASAGGEAARGTMWQDIRLDAGASRISFSVHGGHGSVKLFHRGELVRETRGQDSNTNDLPAVWYVEQYRGETVRLMIEDDITGAWGFVSVCGLRLE